MRLYNVPVISNTEIRSGVHLLHVHAPQLAQSVQPGQYCMIRCCPPLATDPLVRRPFFVHTRRLDQGQCTFLVHASGRGTAWLAQQHEQSVLDVLGPLGHGWNIHPTVRTMLLISEGRLISALPLLMQVAIEREIEVALLAEYPHAEEVYPPSLLPADVEYHIVSHDGSIGAQGKVGDLLNEYLPWADRIYCSVSRETSTDLYNRFERLRKKHMAQGSLLQPLICGNGVCLTCRFEAYSGAKLVCRDGPIFDLREIVR